jgi:hypothetical protein
MLRPATFIRYHITAILAAHWVQFVAQYKRWIRPWGPGYWNTGMMQDWDNRNDIYFLPIIPAFQHSTKIVTDVWANGVFQNPKTSLNNILVLRRCLTSFGR